jgi:hypothetical protein
MSDVRTIQVFIASPGDLAVERPAFEDVIEELNAGFGGGVGVKFEPLGWEDTLGSTGRRSRGVINREIDRCDVQKVLDFRKSLDESRQVLYHGFANEAEFKAVVDRHLRAFAKGELPKANAPRDKVLLPLAILAEVQKEKAEKEQALACAERGVTVGACVRIPEIAVASVGNREIVGTIFELACPIPQHSRAANSAG